MKFGIIGAGRHAQNKVMPAIVKAGHEVSAIFSRDAEKAKKIGLKYLSKPYDDMETFLTGDFEAVYISSPNFLHYDHALSSLKRGKHVLLEKQMTLSNEHAEELVRIAEEQNLVLAVGFHMRFHPAVSRSREIISSGGIGRVVQVSGTWAGFSSGSHPEPDRKWWDEEEKSGGGSVMGTGVHVMDTINYILDEKPVKVTSTRLPRKKVIEMTECVTLDYGDKFANAVSSREMKDPDNSLYIFGTAGTIAAKGIFGTAVSGTLEVSGKNPESFEDGNMYVSEVESFVSATRKGRSEIAMGTDGLSVVKIVNAAFEGNFTGKWVDV